MPTRQVHVCVVYYLVCLRYTKVLHESRRRVGTMSGKLVVDIWHAEYGDASEVLVLMALADEATDAGEVSMDMATIAKKARQSERNCRYLLRKMEDLDIIERLEARGRKHKNRYKIHKENLKNLQPVQVNEHNNLQPVQVIEDKKSPNTSDGKKPATSAGYRKPAKPATSAGFNTFFPPDPPSLRQKTQDKDKDPLLFPQTDEQTVLAHLNTATGRRYRTTHHIAARLHDATTVSESILVIDWWAAVKIQQDPEQDRYFDNDTPFRPTKFDKYLAAAEAWEKQGRPHPHVRAPTPTKAEQRAAQEARTTKEMEDVVYGRNTFSSAWDPPRHDGEDLSPPTGDRRQAGLPLGPGRSLA